MKTITLDQIHSIDEYQVASVSVKILWADSKQGLKPGLFKQDLCISDATGTARLTLWQDCIEIGSSYRLQGLMVRSFNRVSYLTIQKMGFTASIEDDIVDRVDEGPNPNLVMDATYNWWSFGDKWQNLSKV